jgi:ABC-type transport system involved in multi-copper enzyme maturation permease subunit
MRGKALWIGLLIAGIPIMFASVMSALTTEKHPDYVLVFSMLVLALVPAMLISASIGEEIEDRTSTYLWSRPIARWAVLAGKLCVLTPVVIALIVVGWCVAIQRATGALPSLQSCAALAGGCVATSLVSAGIATLVPKHSMALTIVYLLIDIFVGNLPFSLQQLSITHQVSELADVMHAQPALATPLIAMAAMAGLWGVIAVLRIRQLEA